MLTASRTATSNSIAFLLCGLVGLSGLTTSAVFGQQATFPDTGKTVRSNQTPIDPAVASWDAKDKYFLTVAASKTAGQDNDLPYAEVDGSKVSAVLQARGYKKIDTLTDKTATRENFIESLKRIRSLKDNGLVVVYYSGHGAIDPQGKDLWLQLYGQKFFGESQGLSVGELIRIARAGVYKGELVVIIDACYSGQGAWTKSLNLGEVENTLIFASNSRTQDSFPIDASATETMSAFTFYLLKGLTDDWNIVDERQQGIILYEDLRTYIEVKLAQLLVKYHQVNKEMTPDISGHPGKIWAAFDPARAQNLTSLLRQAIGFRSHFKTQLPNLLQPNQPLSPPAISPLARELAQRVPATADPYTKALQAIAEERHAEALRLLDDAEKTKVADLSDIYQARGNAMIYSGKFVEGRDWYEKAIRINRKENPELLEEASMVFAIVSDLDQAEVVLKQALEIRERTSKGSAALAGDLMGLAMLQFFQGRLKDAESYIQRVLLFDPKVLDAEEAGISMLPRFLMIVLKVIQEETAEAEKLLKEFEATPSSELPQDDYLRTTARFLLAVIFAGDGRKAEFEALASQFLASWERAINNRDSESLTFYTSFIMGMSVGIANILGRGSELTKRFEVLSRRSVDLVRSEGGPFSPALAMSLFSTATAYSVTGKQIEAESMFLEAIKISEQAFGQNNFIVGIMYAGLGAVYKDVKRYEEAERAFQKSLALAESSTGKTSMFVLMPLEGLAELYEQQGKYDDAVRLYERVIAISQSIWRGSARNTADSFEDIAEIRQKQKKYAEAEKFYKQAIAEREADPLDKSTVSSVIKLGALYFEQQKFKEAEPVFFRAVALAEANIKNKVESLANSLLWLSAVYLAERKLAEANKVANRFDALAQRLSTAEEKDSVANMLMELARNYSEQNADADANRVYQQVLALFKEESDNLRQGVAVRLYNIGQYYVAHGEYKQAESLFQRAIFIDEEVRGKDNIEVAIDLEALAELYRQTKRYRDAVHLYVRAIPIRERVGDKVRVATSSERLGYLYIQLHEYTTARTPLTKALGIWDGMSEPNSGELAACLSDLAVVSYETRQDFEGADGLLRRAISIDEKSTTETRWILAEDLRLLANVYRFQRRYSEAEKTLNLARELLQKTYGPAYPTIPKLLFNLVLVHRAQGKDEAAESALKEALEWQLTASERSVIADWLEYYTSALRYMKRDNEAAWVEVWAKEVRKDAQK